MANFKSFTEYINEHLGRDKELSLINEGLYDKHIFKCIFILGGAGSGKSYVSKKVLAGTDLKTVNSDIFFMYLLDKHNISKHLASLDPAELERALSLRDKGTKLTDKQLDTYLAGRLGLIIEGTGKDYEKIKKQRDKMVELGYDTYAIMVNASLEVSLERNRARSAEGDRTLSDELVKSMWTNFQKNIGKFQHLFGLENFLVVDNNATENSEKIFKAAYKKVLNWLNKKTDNPTAIKWIKQQQELKKQS